MKTIKHIAILLTVAIASFIIGYQINQKAKVIAELKAEFYYNMVEDACGL